MAHEMYLDRTGEVEPRGARSLDVEEISFTYRTRTIRCQYYGEDQGGPTHGPFLFQAAVSTVIANDPLFLFPLVFWMPSERVQNPRQVAAFYELHHGRRATRVEIAQGDVPGRPLSAPRHVQVMTVQDGPLEYSDTSSGESYGLPDGWLPSDDSSDDEVDPCLKKEDEDYDFWAQYRSRVYPAPSGEGDDHSVTSRLSGWSGTVYGRMSPVTGRVLMVGSPVLLGRLPNDETPMEEESLPKPVPRPTKQEAVEARRRRKLILDERRRRTPASTKPAESMSGLVYENTKKGAIDDPSKTPTVNPGKMSNVLFDSGSRPMDA